ncbi:MAG: hypothetical protein HHJ12_15955 [Glaciimonas sp.]|nr:hypothetical protein [Glaciimonas sp.]
MPGAPDQFVLDREHVFDTGRAVPVCRNTIEMIANSRYHSLFELIGEGRQHYGIFQCGTVQGMPAYTANTQVSEPGGCGC